MTTRTITIDLKTILDSGWAYGTVSFEMITDVATSGAAIYPQSLQKVKMDVDGVGSVDLAVPATGAWVYEVRLPSTQESQIVVEDGAAVTLAELLETGLTPVPPSGDAYWVRLDGTNTPMTGELLLSGDPVSNTGAATKQSVDGKADKDTDAIVGNLAEFDASGNPVDSGIAAGDFDALNSALIPAAVTDLAAMTSGIEQIALSWTYTAVGYVENFKLYRKTGVGGTYALIASPALGDTSYTDSGLTSDTEYYYRLDAYNPFFTTEGNETSATANGFTYYVNSITGDDLNSGLSASVPFATIGALTATGLAAGESVGLAAGSSWREQLDVPGDGCTIGVYGTGAAPLLDASDVIVAGDWTKTGGQTNVYQADVSLLGNVDSQVTNVWENDAFLTRVASVALCDSTAGSFYPSAEFGNITLYIHPVGSTNPISDGKTYETNTRQFGLNGTSRNTTTIRGIHGRRNRNPNGSIVVGKSSFIYDSTASDGCKHNLLHEDGCYLENVAAVNSNDISNTGGNPIIGFDAAPTGLGLTYVNCTVTRDSYKSGSAFLQHGGNFGDILYSGCAVENCSTAYGSTVAENVIITNSTADGCGIGIAAVTDTVVNGGVYTIADIGAGADNAIQLTPVSGKTITLNGVTINSNKAGAIAIISINNAWNVVIDDCTFGASNIGFPLYLTAANHSLTLTNTTFGATTYFFRLETPYTLSADFNTYGSGGFRLGATLYNWADYRTLTGQDSNSTYGV